VIVPVTSLANKVAIIVTTIIATLAITLTLNSTLAVILQ
jgi:hypothetical protein